MVLQPEISSWPLAAPLETFGLEVRLAAGLWATGWNRAISRPWEIRVQKGNLAWSRPRVISVALAEKPVPCQSFLFAQAEPWPAQPGGLEPSLGRYGPERAPAGRTPIRPPGDVVKLEERLRYLLEPPVELLLAGRRLGFPVRPYPFQLEGVAFLYPRQSAVLADEMGLGKTMQAITAVRLLLHSGELRKVLLVCPKSLVSNWRRELAHWAPELPVVSIEGDQPQRLWQWQWPGAGVRIANYELLARDRQILQQQDASGRPCVWFDLVILDEAQRIKNRAGATHQAACALSRLRRWALTGTPLENSPEDLLGIFEFIAPGLLSEGMKPRAIGRTIRDYLLRRTKEEVLGQLPPRLLCDARLELTPEQRETYQLARDAGVLRLSRMGHSATIRHVFELVLRLKQICNFDPATGASAKLQRLEADLEELVASGRKAVVFSQWVQTLQRLAGALRRFDPAEFHGQVPPPKREAALHRFRRDRACRVLLISYGAGGLGLNLQVASYVFLFDRWWNPAVEDQAIHRVHRIGTSGPVTVVRFLMLETIEERIDRIVQQKRELFDAVFCDVHGPGRFGLTQEELFGLFDLRMPGGPAGLAA
ncbi:MAG: DEAD/DEAH box helicase [Thermoguttaceae bacterium]